MAASPDATTPNRGNSPLVPTASPFVAQRRPFAQGPLASRKAEEAASRRFQAAAWITSVVVALDMPTEPTEEEFRLSLRNGLVLCSLINKVQPGAVPKVVENVPSHSPEGKPLSAYQYFENIRNFLVAVEEMNLPTFEASDLEQGSLQAGSTTKIVDCILALKSYYEWKKSGGTGSWKQMGLLKSPMIPRISGVTQGNSSCALGKISENVINLSDGCIQKNCRQLDLSGHERSVFTEAATNKECDPNMGQTQQADAEQRLVNIVHSKDIIGAWLKIVVEEIANSKENIDQNLSDRLQAVMLNGSTQTLLNLAFAALAEKREKLSLIEKRQDQESHLCSNSTQHKNDGYSDTQSQCSKLSRSRKEYQMILETQRKEVMDMRILLQTTREDVQVMHTEYQKQFELIGNHIQGLSTAAAGYHKILQENKNLYNALQDLKGNIRVYCRVRPFFAGQSLQSTVDFIGEDGSLLIVNPSKMGKDVQKMFNFNKIFGPSATQDEVYQDTQPLIRSVMDGYNVCIFAYGQTGSGKTHTMSGPTGASEKEMGVNYRALSDLFQLSQARKDLMKYEVYVQMIEIYNEQVRDLLGTDTSNKKLDIRNSGPKNGFNVPEASVLPVTSTSDVLNLMNFGQKNRAVSSTALNDRSSRSHSVLTVHVQGTDRVSGFVIHSCLHLVDLAGSERVDKSEVTGDRLKEAQHINKSLSALGDVIAALAQKNSHVPYRNSKLTQLLQDSLGGQAKTLMFVHISPELDSYGETISTLKFAERVASVELGAARVNKESAEVRELREQLESLKKALARKEGDPGHIQSMRGSPVTMEKHRTKIENMQYRRSSLDVLGCGNDEQLKEGLSKAQDFGEKVKLNNTDVQMSKTIRRSSIGYVSDRRCSLNGKTPDTCQSQKAKGYPPRTPEHKSLSSGTDISPNQGTEISSKSSETERSEMNSLNVVVTPSKKSSNIRKSLQTFGRFINGGERRNMNQVQPISPVSSNDRRFSNGRFINGSEKRITNQVESISPLSSKDRRLSSGQSQLSARRQSLTGATISGGDLSRRASIGKAVETRLIASPNGYVESHLKTSSGPAQPSKTSKRWL